MLGLAEGGRRTFDGGPRRLIRLAKMDIEGSEWVVLPDLVAENLLCQDKIQAIMMELHTPENHPELHMSDGAGNLAFKTRCPECSFDFVGVDKLLAG